MDKDYLRQKLDNSRLKCIQGSHFFNGSCYFISNMKYTQSSSVFESDILIDYLKKRAKAKSPLLDMGNKNALSSPGSNMPNEESWNNAVQSCLNLNNDSGLIHFQNDFEYEFLKGLLTKLHFPYLIDGSQQQGINIYGQEQKYYIGLTHNSKLYKVLY